MSVYKKGRIWHYDFQYQGRRYYGSTGQENLRAAEAVERAKRLEAATGAREDAGHMTLDMAASRYFDEIAHGKRDQSNLIRRISVAVDCVGRHKLLREIEAADIMQAISKRRRLRHKGKQPSNTTVNRDIIDTTMRPILNRARRVWGARNMPEIDWKALRSQEPRSEHREYTTDQIEAWKAELEPLPRFALHLFLTYGFRLSEIECLPVEAVDGVNHRIVLAGKHRKRDETLIIPLLDEDSRLLAAMAGRAKALGLPYVFFYKSPERNYPRDGIGRRLRSAAKRAGLEMPRVVHGARHHAGTQMLRTTGNLKLAQKLLGHASIQSTVRYAKASEDDLRQALSKISRNSPEGDSGTPDKTMKSKGKNNE